MQQHTAKKFLQDNADALVKLSERIEHFKKINPESKYSEKERFMATQLVEEWISECFNVAYDNVDFPKPSEETNIYRRSRKSFEE